MTHPEAGQHIELNTIKILIDSAECMKQARWHGFRDIAKKMAADLRGTLGECFTIEEVQQLLDEAEALLDATNTAMEQSLRDIIRQLIAKLLRKKDASKPLYANLNARANVLYEVAFLLKQTLQELMENKFPETETQDIAVESLSLREEDEDESGWKWDDEGPPLPGDEWKNR